jgi:creatinine amidohydrolase
MKLQDLTWIELRSLPRETVVVVPLASCEQHSAHLPFGTDMLVVDAIADALEAHLDSDVLRLPTLPFAYSARHLPMKGTLSVPLETYVEMVAATVTSVAQAGFRRILLLNAQSDNAPTLGVTLRLLRERHPGAVVVAVSYWSLLESDDEAGHADELETSLMLHLHPERVRSAEIARDEMASPSLYSRVVMQYTRMDQRSHHGGVGNPERASAERGRDDFERIVRSLVALTEDLRDGILAG